MGEIDKMFERIKLDFSPENMEKLSKNAYNDDRNYPECFSNWFPHIIDFGYFNHAEVISNQIFTWEETEVMHESETIKGVKWEKLNKILKPTLDKMLPYKVYNIKNGCFSNKFDFKTCLATREDLAEQLWKINYQSGMFETGGYTELVVREYIPYEYKEVPTIYDGMPLREELRVFYNLDKKKIEYIVDYWDYDYCYDNIHSITDKIIFNWFHNKTAGRNESHKLKLEQMETTVCEKINTLKYDDTLKGIWSIDFMLSDNKIYLIDMARGCRSAYWDVNKLSSETREEFEIEIKG